MLVLVLMMEVLLALTIASIGTETTYNDIHISNSYKDICGWTWQKDYSKLHRRIMAGELPPKFIISIPVKQGLADMTHGYITAFMWALLSNRAFLIERVNRLDDERQHTIDFAYHSAYFNWTSPLIARSDYECLLPPYNDPNSVPCKEDSKMAFGGHHNLNLKYVNGVNGGFPLSLRDWNVSEQYSEYDVLITASNKGTTQLLFDNPYHREELLTRFNFTRQTIFPCLFHFLFHLNRGVCGEGCLSVADKLRNAGKDPLAIRIAMHVRNPRRKFYSVLNTSHSLQF
jgi:hypothetical protein